MFRMLLQAAPDFAVGIDLAGLAAQGPRLPVRTELLMPRIRVLHYGREAIRRRECPIAASYALRCSKLVETGGMLIHRASSASSCQG